MINDGRVYFAGARRQRGSGLGGVFGAIGRHLIPFLKQFILPHAASAIGSIASDFANKKQPFKASFKAHGKEALKRAGQDILNQTGSGKQRKKTSKKRKPAAAKNKKYLF